jgi:ABC-type uncharacterized transport system substrate-binding protein
MRRRKFMTLLGGAAIVPLATRAQQPERMRHVGVLMAWTERDPEVRAWATAFKEGLQRLGWTQDRNVRIDFRWGGGDYDRLRTYAAELVGMGPDVIFATATPALAPLSRETRSLPIVFVQVSDPVKLGFVANLAHQLPGLRILSTRSAANGLNCSKTPRPIRPELPLFPICKIRPRPPICRQSRRRRLILGYG